MISEIPYDYGKMFDNFREQKKLYEKLLRLKYEEDEMIKDLASKPIGAEFFKSFARAGKKSRKKK